MQKGPEYGVMNEFNLKAMERLSKRVHALARELGVVKKYMDESYFFQQTISHYWEMRIWELHSEKQLQDAVKNIVGGMF